MSRQKPRQRGGRVLDKATPEQVMGLARNLPLTHGVLEKALADATPGQLGFLSNLFEKENASRAESKRRRLPGQLRDPRRRLRLEPRVRQMGRRVRRRGHGRRGHRPHRPPRRDPPLPWRILPERTLPHEINQTNNKTRNQPPTVFRLSAEHVHLNLTKYSLQPFRPVGPVGPVLVGREPRAASRLAADGGLVAADPQRDLAHAEPLAVPQLVDPDAFLCRQVGIGFHIECNAFSSVVDLNTSNHRQALHFYLEPGDVEKLVEYAVHQALCGCLFILVENILPGKRSSLTPSTTQRRNPTHENSNSAIIYVFQPNLSPVLTFYNQNKVHWATFSNFGV
ncbi:Uncharacterised protein [Bifidobacterium longum]|nr:Uncharacterised protein [Bifidobacterium longum]